MATVKTLLTWLVALAGEEVGRPGHTPATSSSAADQDIDIVNASSGNPDHGHSSCAGGAHQLPTPNHKHGMDQTSHEGLLYACFKRAAGNRAMHRMTDAVILQ